jgi:deazaflavin-dependent oxidoreductase (nitroreductase family)
MEDSFIVAAKWLGQRDFLRARVRKLAKADKWVQARTNNRFSVVSAAGLPNVVITVPGRKSGKLYSSPLLCTPYLNGTLIAGSNFGNEKPPAWVANLVAAIENDVTINVRIGPNNYPSRATQLLDEAYAEAWAHMTEIWPSYNSYAARVDRVIPVFFLEPRA